MGADPEILPGGGTFVDPVEVVMQSQTQNARIRHTTGGAEPDDDLAGRALAILVDQDLPPGNYKRVFDATGLASGTYFYRMTGENFVQTRKLLLLK
jgi:hypothetical protein